MLRRLHSIAWKFPLLLTGLVLATAVIFVMAAYVQFAGTLYDASGQRLRTAGLLVANMLGQTVPTRQAQLAKISRDPAVVEFLRSGKFESEAAAAIQRSSTTPPEPGRMSARLFDATGREKLSFVWSDSVPTPAWAVHEIRKGSFASAPFTIGPILDNNGSAQYQLVSRVVDAEHRAGKPKVIGYLVDSRVVAGRGQKAIQDLIGGGATLLLGQPGGSWTDLEKIVAGTPPINGRHGVPFSFDKSPRGPGIGVAQPVPGTSWVLWLQQPRSLVLAPVNKFVLRLVFTAGWVALLGALLVWLFSRRVTNRIVRLTEEVDRMEPGNRPEAVTGRYDTDEISKLGVAFERMSERLKSHRELEMQLRQSQKLEAVGRLAGGIAHDFNNILTVIRNYGELVREELPGQSEVCSDMDEILLATDRASGLTRQLLTFSRHQIVTPRVLDLNAVIQSSERMLRRLVPTNIEIVTTLSPNLGRITADSGQLEQVILNLTINAADALPTGGRITIHTQNAELDDTFSKSIGSFANGVAPDAEGPYASLVVTDNGSGMDAATVAKIFDPFFTTKDPGKGTGLGLSTVHGIVNQNGGRIWVYSEPGRGTTFKLYFPIVRQDIDAVDLSTTPPAVAGEIFGATVLLVEDDPATREVTRRVLTRGGFVVLEATNGVEGLEALERPTRQVDVVLTDLMMPRMSGIELSERVAELYPDMPVLLISGYADVEMNGTGHLHTSRQFLEKPFTAAALLAFVRNAVAGVGAA
ncbi:MAG TPA: response regulator [Gemmatimonadaceae bacterium]|nr:response regulator [Gemmatimonadaceae bacterium]